jgi:hypothetical protein
MSEQEEAELTRLRTERNAFKEIIELEKKRSEAMTVASLARVTTTQARISAIESRIKELGGEI